MYHGYGKLYLIEGDIFEGKFKNNKKENGKLSKTNKEFYEGDFEND